MSGRLMYIDPLEDFGKINTNDIIYPYENFSMAVDLTVKIADRYSCGHKTDEEKKVLKFSSSNGSLSFLSGGKDNSESSFLTTKYTDVSFSSPLSNTNECLGIESINITYNSWMYPQVTIKFIDTRGASIMAPAEANLNNGNSNDSNNNEFFRSFFTFPYPMFELKVKGFYGKGVTYTLAVQKTNIDFDSQNGSFIFTVDFIGYMYGILADFPITYAAIAPYMDGGKEYWDSQVKNGHFKFKGENGLPDKDFYKLPELKDKIARVLQNGQNSSDNNLITQGVDNINAINDSITKYHEYLDYYIFNDWNEYDSRFYKEFEGEYNFETEKNNLIKFIKIYESDNTLKNTITFEGNIGYKYVLLSQDNGYKVDKIYKIDKDGLETEDTNSLYNYDDELLKDKCGVFNSENNSLAGWTFGANNNPSKIVYIFYNSHNYKYIKDKITNIISTLKSEKNRTQSEIEAEKNKKITELLEFAPSIRNIYNLIFAHIETFMYCFFKQTKNIKDKLKTEKRNSSFCGVPNTATTDIDSKDDKKPLPPYFGYYTPGKNGKLEMSWPGDFNKELDEVNFINQLVNASELYFKIEEDFEQNRNANNEIDKNEINNIQKEFIPITLYDFLMNEDKNPYSSLLKTITTKSDLDIATELLSIFLIRCYYFLGRFSDSSLYDIFAQVEALNLYKALVNNIDSSGFKKLLDILNRSSLSNYFSYVKDNDGNRLFDKISKPHIENRISFPIGEYKKNNIKNDSTTLSNTKYIPSPTSTKDETYEGINAIKIITTDEVDNILNNINNEFKSYDISTFTDDIKAKIKGEDIDMLKILDLKYIYGSDNATESSIIKNPSYVEFGASDKPVSIYSDDFNGKLEIKNNNDDKIFNEAFLFLASIPLKSNISTYSYAKNISEDRVRVLTNKTGSIPKLMLLKEGAYYWAQKKGYTNIIANKEGNNYVIKDFYKINENKTKYHTLTSSYDGYRGIHFFTFENRSTSYSSLPIYEKFFFWKNKKKDLMSIFVKWVQNEYKNYRSLLQNRFNYVDGDIKKGLKGGDDKNAKKIQDFLHSTLFDKWFIINPYDGFYEDNKSSKFPEQTDAVNKSLAKFETLVKGLIYPQIKRTEEVQTSDNTKITESNILKDAKISSYITLKALYDKWLCSENGYGKWTLNNSNSIFNSFKYVDTFYNDIGDHLYVNIEKIANFLYNAIPSISNDGGSVNLVQTSLTIYDFLIKVAEDCGGMLLILPTTFGNYNDNRIKEMFRPQTIYNAWDETVGSSTFLFMYTYKPSEHLGDKSISLNGWTSDGLDLNDDDMDKFIYNEGFNIPAFSVSYAQQNQSIFKNIRLNTESAGLTEPAIGAMYQIAAKGSEIPRQTLIYGQDLYKIFSSYSYKCEVSCMGNMEIMPMMLFQLNNIPLWRGAYQIIKVNHNISAGNINTSFEGLRMNKYAIPLLKDAMIMGTINKRDESTNFLPKGDNKVKLTLIRDSMVYHGTYGKLYINGVFFCHTFEDEDRGLNNKTMTTDEVVKKKVYGQTAIPTGVYRVSMNVVSPKFVTRNYTKPYYGKLPRLYGVKGWPDDDVLIHPGNDIGDTGGCILVGKTRLNNCKGLGTGTTETVKELIMKIYELNGEDSGETTVHKDIEIEVKRTDAFEYYIQNKAFNIDYERKMKEYGLVDISSNSNTNIQVELKYSTKDNFVGDNVYGNLKNAYFYKQFAEKIWNCAKVLNEMSGTTCRLIIYDAARPVSTQVIFNNKVDDAKLVAAVKCTGEKYASGSRHCYGAAVDLTIGKYDEVTKKYEPLDMGIGFDTVNSSNTYYTKTGINRSKWVYDNVSVTKTNVINYNTYCKFNDDQKANRLFLFDVLTKGGLTPYKNEWWHWQDTMDTFKQLKADETYKMLDF